jgi:hypothetical protein
MKVNKRLIKLHRCGIKGVRKKNEELEACLLVNKEIKMIFILPVSVCAHYRF